MPQVADVLERCARDLHGLAFDAGERGRTVDLEAAVIRVCAEAMAAVHRIAA